MQLLDQSAVKTKKGLPYFENPEIEKLGWVIHRFLTRQGGVSLSPYDSLNLSADNGDLDEHVIHNKDLVAKAFVFDPNRLILLNQIHQDKILILKKDIVDLPPLLEYDALITNVPNTFLSILTADCLPIFMIDQKRKVVAAIHVGRNGTALHLTTKVLKKMKKEFDCLSKDLLMIMGPSIGPCCYEVDEKVFQKEWKPFSIEREKGRWMVDLAEINMAQMKKEGMEDQQISKIDLCTRCHSDLFFSYRKEGRTGRQLSFIGILE